MSFKDVSNQNVLCIEDDHDESSRKIYFPLYIKSKLGFQKRLCFLDSGSDVNLLSLELLQLYFSEKEIAAMKLPKRDYNLVSFSNGKIKIYYEVKLPVTFDKSLETFETIFAVISPIPGTPHILCGSPFMRQNLFELKYTGDKTDPVPEILVCKFADKPYPVDTFYLTNEEVDVCVARLNLSSYDTTPVCFEVKNPVDLLPGNLLLLSGEDDGKRVALTASRSKCFEDKGTLKCWGIVTNHNDFNFMGSFETKPELLGDYNCVPIIKENREVINKLNVLTEISKIPSPLNDYQITLKAPIVMDEECQVIKRNLFKITAKFHKINRPGGDNDLSYLPKRVKVLREEQSPYSPGSFISRINSLSKTDRKYKDVLDVEAEPQHIKDDFLNEFNDPEKTIQMDPNQDSNPVLDSDITCPYGYELPTSVRQTPEEIVQLQNFDKELQPHIKRIFLDKYSKVLSTSALSAGNLSKTLGKYEIRLKEGETLPRHKRIYFLNPKDSAHLKDILDFLEKNNIIMKAPVSESNVNNDLFGSPSYLIPKSNPEANARLIIDLRFLNSLIQSEVPVMEDVGVILHSLRECCMFSKTDLSNAFYSYQITENSRYLTNFVTPHGNYYHRVLPMGMKSSGTLFQAAALRMLHEEVVRDEKGDPIFESENKVKLKPSKIPFVFIYYDDVLVGTTPEKTYELTVQKHFEKVEKVISRLHFHDARLSFAKSSFAKSKISFLGWFVSYNFLLANPKRVEKILQCSFPEVRKGMKSFLGMISALRLCLSLANLPEVKILTPLTSASAKYEPTNEHKLAFESLKKKLAQSPIYTKILDPLAPKILYTDATTLESGYYSAVLCQISRVDPEKPHIPSYLTFDDRVHRLIYDHGLKYEPVPILRTQDEINAFLSKRKTTEPYNDSYLEQDFLGYEENEVDDSFFISIRILQAINKCKVNEIHELRVMAVKQLNKSILRIKFNDFNFNNNAFQSREFLNNFKSRGQVDENFLLVEAAAEALYRPIYLISSLEQNVEKPIIKFNVHIKKPPYILGVYRLKNTFIFRPFFQNKESFYDISQHKGNFEIIGYHSRNLPTCKKGYPILQHELYALLSSLEYYRKYIGTTPCKILTDSKALYLLFHQEVHMSNVKMLRWSMKLKSDFPNIKLHFVPSHLNISDFLSKKFNVPAGDIPKITLAYENVSNDLIETVGDKIFSLDEWAKFVTENPQHLKQKELSVRSLQTMTNNLDRHLKPLKILLSRMENIAIQTEQKIEFDSIYKDCLLEPDFKKKHQDFEYQIINGLLYIFIDTEPKIYLPTNMIGLFLSYFHMSSGHAGYSKLQTALDPYYFKNKSTIISKFLAACYPCLLNNRTTRREKLGWTPMPSHPYQFVHLDMAEDIGPAGDFKHLLLILCPLTNFLIIHPLKTKSSTEIANILLYGVFQIWNVQYIHSDNATGFNEKNFLSLLATLGIQKLQTSSLHPMGKGKIEAYVKIVKTCLKKYLVNHKDLNYEGLPYIISKVLNSTRNHLTNVQPNEFVFGPDNANSQPFEVDHLPKLHENIGTLKEKLEERFFHLKNTISKVRHDATEYKNKQLENLNRNRISKDFVVGQIVFTFDRTNILGATRPLKSLYLNSPFIVKEVYHTTVAIQRLADGFRTVYSKNDLKAFTPLDPMFMTLPLPVLNVIKHPTEMDHLAISILQRHDTFHPPVDADFSEVLTEKVENVPSKSKNQNVEPENKDDINEMEAEDDDLEIDINEPSPDHKVLRSGRQVRFKAQ